MSNTKSSKYQSLVITAIVGVLTCLLLFLSLEFKQENLNKPLLIEIAMLQESNYGNTDIGQGLEEPKPAEEQPLPAKSEVSQPEISEHRINEAPVKSQTQETTKKIPVASKEKKTEAKPAKTNTQKESSKNSNAPKGDAQGKSALEQILGGKGKSNSNGQGDGNQAGNVGDPKGNSDKGTGIGENWKTRVPENQAHNCSASGVVVVDIVVNANGSIKRATPRVSGNQCLANRAKELVLQYVTAFPGADGRRGTYKVNLR
ncbi:hypothetical protein KRX57_02720 [Weeksellaceae bacterium TAE3-ERU29]|nr:hypothetical protein [Weeksellaceae bacterium TAE3-ERU29]